MPRLKASIAERLNAHSKREGKCLVWTLGRDRYGYGRMSVAGKYKGVHRIAWEAKNGSIPSGLCVLHSCDNPPCLAVEHLFLGTQDDNTVDKVKKNRHAFGERNGRAKITKKEVYVIRSQYEGGRKTQKELANDFKLCPASISFILRGVNWAHL